MAGPTMLALDLDPHRLRELSPPASISEARTSRDELARLLTCEREAGGAFLLALSEFDRLRGWERLGHASLFAFLTRELGLSRGGAFFRLTAARLVQRFPEVVDPLKDGRLCITSVVELARVLTPENRAEVLPLFFGCSSREAREVAAALDPRPNSPTRDVVTTLPTVTAPVASAPGSQGAARAPFPSAVQSPEPVDTTPAAPRTEVRPLTAELRRLHVTVTARFLEKVAAAREGLSHAMPRATIEQVLERALDLLLERQARTKGLVRRPRSGPAPRASRGNPRRIPAAVSREVRLRDGGRCQYPLDSGGVCGSTWQVELDHIHPLALGGETSVANLRCACRLHNQRSAEALLGAHASASARAARKRRAWKRGPS